MPEHDRVEDLLYYLNLMQGRQFTGCFVVWLNGGRISRSTFQKLRRHLRLAGVLEEETPEEMHHAER